MSPRRGHRTAAEKKAEVLRAVRNLDDRAMDRFLHELSGVSRRDLALVRRVIQRERDRRAQLQRERSRLARLARGQAPLAFRRGRHRTLLGESPEEDRDARVAILGLHGAVRAILQAARRRKDPGVAARYLDAYLVQFEGLAVDESRQVIRTTMDVVARDRCRGVPSTARRIARELIRAVGIPVLVDGDKPAIAKLVRKPVVLTDQHLRRIIEKGDPLWLSPQKARQAREEAMSKGVRRTLIEALVRAAPDARDWRLSLRRSGLPDKGQPMPLVELVIEYGLPGPGEPRDERRLSPSDRTPVGIARDVVREWAATPGRDLEQVGLARLFLRRRR